MPYLSIDKKKVISIARKILLTRAIANFAIATAISLYTIALSAIGNYTEPLLLLDAELYRSVSLLEVQAGLPFDAIRCADRYATADCLYLKHLHKSIESAVALWQTVIRSCLSIATLFLCIGVTSGICIISDRH